MEIYGIRFSFFLRLTLLVDSGLRAVKKERLSSLKASSCGGLTNQLHYLLCQVYPPAQDLSVFLYSCRVMKWRIKYLSRYFAQQVKQSRLIVSAKSEHHQDIRRNSFVTKF